MLSLYDIGCRWPECTCKVPDFAFSEHNRIQYCLSALSANKGKIMENDTTIGTVELVSSEVSGYLDSEGKFAYGEPVADKAAPAPKNDEAEEYVAYAQSAEDAING